MDDVFLDGVVDLFGDPVPRSRGRKGRPPHVPTAENRRFVQMALAMGRSEEEIAEALRLTPRTLERHYFHELSGKRSARMRLEMKTLGAIVEQVEAGNVAAMSLLDKKLERERLREGGTAFAGKRAATPKPPKLGKKEQLTADAKAGSKSGEWGSLLKH